MPGVGPRLGQSGKADRAEKGKGEKGLATFDIPSSFRLEYYDDFSKALLKKDGEDEDSEDEIWSLIDEPSWREVGWNEEFRDDDSTDEGENAEKSHRGNLYQQKLEQLEARHSFRDKIFQRATAGKGKAFVQLLQKREQAVREAERELLFWYRDQTEGLAGHEPPTCEPAVNIAGVDCGFPDGNASTKSEHDHPENKSSVRNNPNDNQNNEDEPPLLEEAPTPGDDDSDNEDDDEEEDDDAKSLPRLPLNRKHNYSKYLLEETKRNDTEQSKGMKQRTNSKKISEDNEGKEKSSNSKTKAGNAQPVKQSLMNQLYETVIFELNTTLPAIVSVTIYTMATSSFYNTVTSVIYEIHRKVNPNGGQVIYDLFYLSSFLMGMYLMKLSGYIYYFLPDNVYDCAKLDYHNQIRLGTWHARWLRWIQLRPRVAKLLYLTGWYIAYPTIGIWLSKITTRFVNQRESLVNGLPSYQYDDDYSGMCVSDDQHYSAPFFSCNAEINRQENEYWNAYYELQKADKRHISTYFSVGSESVFWGEWARLEPGWKISSALYGPCTEILIYLVSMVASWYLLFQYGYDIFKRG